MGRSQPDDRDVPAPSVPHDRLAGWERVEASVERLYGVAGTDVRGHTLVYEDRTLRAAVREATGGAVDRAWRFFFATRLRFRPRLAPGAASLLLPTVRTEAAQSFRADLRDRGVCDVELGRRERLRTDGGERLHLRQVTGTVPAPGGEVPVEGWVCVRHTDDIHVAGGAYPRTPLSRALGVAGGEDERVDDSGGSTDEGGDADLVLAHDPEADREELFALVAAVG